MRVVAIAATMSVFLTHNAFAQNPARLETLDIREIPEWHGAVGTSSRTYVVNKGQNLVYAFDKNGIYVTTALEGDRVTGGPILIAAITARPTQLLMLDGRRPRIVAATLKSSLPRITPVLDVPGTPIDFCATKDRIITYGTDSGGTIRAFSDAGRPLWAQLVRPGSERPQAAFALARGGIYCAEQAGVVLVVSTFEPIVRAFSLSNGKQVWSTALSPFTSIEMDSTDAYRTVITIPPTGHDQTIGAYGAQKNLVAIQIAHIDPRTGQFDRRIDTRLLAANTGTQVDRRQGLFRVIGTETGKLVSIKP